MGTASMPAAVGTAQAPLSKPGVTGGVAKTSLIRGHANIPTPCAPLERFVQKPLPDLLVINLPNGQLPSPGPSGKL